MGLSEKRQEKRKGWDELLILRASPEGAKLTQMQAADAVGISHMTVRRIEEDPEFIAEKRKLVLRAVEDALPEILKSAVKCAKNDSFLHQNMLLKLSGLMVEKSKVEMENKVEIYDYSSMSAQDLIEIKRKKLQSEE